MSDVTPGNMTNIIQQFTEKPKTLLLIDSIGALITAFCLFFLMRQWNDYFGMPEKELTILSGIALCFCMYSAVCFLWVKRGLPAYIRIIGIANLLYCVLTGGLVITYYPLLTHIGIAYFLMEIAIICGLSYVELQVAKKIAYSGTT